MAAPVTRALRHSLAHVPGKTMSPNGATEKVRLVDIVGFSVYVALTNIPEGELLILRMSWHQLKACPRPRLSQTDHASSCHTVFGFCYLLVWGYIADLSMVPRLRRGRLAGRALRTPFYLARSKLVDYSEKRGRSAARGNPERGTNPRRPVFTLWPLASLRTNAHPPGLEGGRGLSFDPTHSYCYGVMALWS